MSINEVRNFAEFAAALAGKRVALVYSSRFEGEPADTWYHRWRSDIIGLYSCAAEALGMEQVYFNVDQYLEAAGRFSDRQIDYIVNLNAGNRFLGNLVLVPAVAQWNNTPAAFCNARTSIVSEDKKLSKLLAQEARFTVPKPLDSLRSGDSIISKPVNMGSSVGVKRMSVGDLVPDGFMAEEFIKGLDGTIVLVLNAAGTELQVLGGQIVIPNVDNPDNWIYSEAAKEGGQEAPKIEYRKVSVGENLAAKAIQLAKLCGSGAVARIDIRYTGSLSEEVMFDETNSVFIEYNAMPTMGRKNSVNEYVGRYLELESNSPIAKLVQSFSSDQAVQNASYLLAAGLYTAQLQMK